eukprot:761518-Hanusia_phi.AAC.2
MAKEKIESLLDDCLLTDEVRALVLNFTDPTNTMCLSCPPCPCHCPYLLPSPPTRLLAYPTSLSHDLRAGDGALS